MSSIEILGTKISRLGFDQALKACEVRVESREGGYVCFANVHTVTESESNPALKAALNGAFLAVADGVPLVWTSRIRKCPIESRVCGPDFMTALLRKHPEWSYGLIGGQPGQAEVLAQLFNLRHARCYSPPIRGFSPENVREDLVVFKSVHGSDSLPPVIWVGLGAPKQELWMQEAARLEPKTLFFGVGAAFDFLTGTKSRAPQWMQKRGLEWLHRLTQEPGRLWKRYFITNSCFIAYSLRDTVRRPKSHT